MKTLNDLIWFAVPGAILLAAFRVAAPGLLPLSDLLTAAAVPILGFVLHQIYRTLFESLGGWHSHRRKVIAAIKSEFGHSDTIRSYLVWELVFYSNAVDASFRDHDRGAWHYIMSFRSSALSAGVGASLVILAGPHESVSRFFVAAPFMAGAALFGWKSHLTWRLLQEQEVAFFRLNHGFFASAHEKLNEPNQAPEPTS
jgi:hypothetical protein